MKIFIFTFAIFLSAFSLGLTKQNSIATLSMDNGKVVSTYKLLVKSSEKEAFLERISTKASNRTIKIKKDLAMTIKSQLLNLSWQAQFRSKRTVATNNCKKTALITVQYEDQITICADQRSEYSRAGFIQKNLDKLIDLK